MKKLSIRTVQSQLLAEDEAKKVSYAKQKLSPNRSSKEVGKPSFTPKGLTKITQVDIPSGKALSSNTEKGISKGTGGMGIPQASEIKVDKVPAWSNAKNEKSPSVPAVKKGEKPNQTTKTREVTNTIKNTEAGANSGKSDFPSANFASTYVDKMAHGNKTLKDSGDSVPEVKAPKAKDLGQTTRGKTAEKKATFNQDTKKVDQISGPNGDLPSPKDAPKTPSWKTDKGGALNVRESVVVRLGDKVKARFDLVNEGVLKRMVESYASHGYKLTVERGDTAAWRRDRQFIKLVRESIDAKYNLVPAFHKSLRKEALNRFYSLSQNSFNDLYETRNAFADTVRVAFERIMANAEKAYLTKEIQLFECMARINKDGTVADIEIVTEATDSEMALRQVRGTIQENYGMDAGIVHIFVDGKKFKPEQIKDWYPK